MKISFYDNTLIVVLAHVPAIFVTLRSHKDIGNEKVKGYLN